MSEQWQFLVDNQLIGEASYHFPPKGSCAAVTLANQCVHTATLVCSRHTMVDLGRIQKELKEIEKDKASGVTVQLKGNNLQALTGYVPGPKETPYDGGLFIVDIDLDDQYPFVPPKMRFVTKVWHPNISSQNGAICLDILKDQWSPALTIKTALLSLQALLSSPQPDDPQDAVVARQYMNEHETYKKTAKYWTEAFANPHSASQAEKIQRLTDMGFSKEAAVSALAAAGGDDNAALEHLLSQ